MIKVRFRHVCISVISAVAVMGFSSYNDCDGAGELGQEVQQRQWPIHSLDRPAPEEVKAADGFCGLTKAPEGALVLFDGSDLKGWRSDNGDGPANWKVENGYMEVNNTGGIHSAEEFDNFQLHIEWATPGEVHGDSQHRGNSGVFMLGRYEVQILDSYDNPTYPDGQAGSLYGQKPPIYNVCRKPGEWQSYDICFVSPQFNDDGTLKSAAKISVFQNGVCIQNNYELKGLTFHQRQAEYIAHPAKGPISLQDHGNPTRFRNVWVLPLD